MTSNSQPSSGELPAYKACRDCGHMKPRSAFANGGKYAYCGPCKRVRVKKWCAANPERVRALAAAKYQRQKKSPEWVIGRRVRIALWRTLKGGKCGLKWFQMVGYSPAELASHLERQFLKGMSWENMGQWHIDHIVPLASFVISGATDPELKRAWALSNLRPLWAKQNMSKGAKIECLL